MVKISGVFLASGPHFSPGNVERQTGILFSQQNEPGDIGTTGRYRGQSRPNGSCRLFGPKSGLDLQVPDPGLFEAVERVAGACRAAGATTTVIQLDVAYTEQCNFEMSEEFLSAVARAGVALTISCYPGE